jgi:hypothetical protein
MSHRSSQSPLHPVFSRRIVRVLAMSGIGIACSDDAGAPSLGSSGPDASSGGETGSEDAGVRADVQRGDGSVTKPGIPMFVGVEYQGHSTVSCDDGMTWIANKSDDDTVRCFDPTDCDHNGHAGRGFAVGNGWFMENIGWGVPGLIRRSRDGVVWEPVQTGVNYPSMAFGNGRFIALSRASSISTNDGLTWTDAGEAPLTSNAQPQGARRGNFVGKGFLVWGAGPSGAFSKDGTTWTARNVPTTLGRGFQWAGGIQYGNGAIVMVDSAGTAAWSTDEGASWTTLALSFVYQSESRLLFTGSEFMMWSWGKLHRSTDGKTWTETPTVLRRNGIVVASGSVPLTAVFARSAKGTYIATNIDSYERQRFYRSTDGIVFDELAQGSYVGSHPMTHILWAEAVSSTVCK